MTGEHGATFSPTPQGGQPTPGLCSCGCGRQATKSSGFLWSWHCDPNVPAEEKSQALRLGGRRGAMTPAEVVRLLDGADLDSHEGRQALRDRFLRLRLAGRIGTGVYHDVLTTLSDAAKDQAKGSGQPATRTIEVISRYGPGATEKPA